MIFFVTNRLAKFLLAIFLMIPAQSFWHFLNIPHLAVLLSKLTESNIWKDTLTVLYKQIIQSNTTNKKLKRSGKYRQTII